MSANEQLQTAQEYPVVSDWMTEHEIAWIVLRLRQLADSGLQAALRQEQLAHQNQQQN